jgi:class 3 adenylate cyclase/tetratricopeptide (TPR) repeat protein
VKVCPNCGEENPDKFRLCGFCGTPFEEAPSQEVRKTVTVLFSDLKGSTALGEVLDSESLREVMNRYFEEMQRMIVRHGGTIEKFIGDAVMAVFGIPHAYEDDALRAVRAAWDMKDALASLNAELERRWGVTLANRTGVNTGEVVANLAAGSQRLVTGDTVNTAARLEQAAPELEILIGEPTYRLVRDAVVVEEVEPLQAKGKAEPLPAYRLRSVRSGAMLTRRLDATMVGREQELATLRTALEEATATRSARAVAIVAQAGVGKSRLLEEFTKPLAGAANVTHGRCLPYGEGITFWPVVEIVRAVAGTAHDQTTEHTLAALERLLPADERDDVSQRIASILGLSDADYATEDLFWAIRKVLEAAASALPLVVVVEDVHWAEPTLLDLVTHLLEAAQEAPIVLVTTLRPDLLEQRPDWGDGARSTRIVLEPLSRDETVRFAENLLGGSLDAETVGRVVEASEGNPLYVEQMLSMLIDEGRLAERDGAWVATVEMASISVPPTIHALIAARLDRLEGRERSVIEPAAVIGRIFYRDALERLTELAPADVDGHLGALIRKEFIARDAEELRLGDTYRFGHILIRDAAYGGMLKRTRAELHERFAGWLDELGDEGLTELEEIVGYHLEQAHLYRADLGPLDDRGRELAALAAARLAASGEHAFARGDMPAAANLLGRATALLDAEEAARLALLPDLGEALFDVGELGRAQAVLREAVEQARAHADARLEAQGRLVDLLVGFSANPEGSVQLVLDEAPPAIAALEEAGDHRSVARAWRLLVVAHGTVGRWADAEAAAGRAIEHARLAGDRREEMRNLGGYAMAALYGPLPVPAAVARCREILAEASGDRRSEGLVLGVLSQLVAMQGDFDGARAYYRRARAVLNDLGGKMLAASVSVDSCGVELLAGDPAAAEAELRRDYDALQAMGERYILSTVAALLSDVVLMQERPQEADELCALSEEAAAEDDVDAQAMWRRVRGRILARDGKHAEADRLMQEALQLVEPADAPGIKADVLVDYAEVMLAAGNHDAAGDMLGRALGLYQEKGNGVAAAQIRAQIAALHPARA